MKKLLTTIYSQPSIEAAKNLINNAIALLAPSGMPVNADTMFYYGIFLGLKKCLLYVDF